MKLKETHAHDEKRQKQFYYAISIVECLQDMPIGQFREFTEKLTQADPEMELDVFISLMNQSTIAPRLKLLVGKFFEQSCCLISVVSALLGAITVYRMEKEFSAKPGEQPTSTTLH